MEELRKKRGVEELLSQRLFAQEIRRREVRLNGSMCGNCKQSVQREKNREGGEERGIEGERLWEKIRGEMKKVWKIWQESCPLL